MKKIHIISIFFIIVQLSLSTNEQNKCQFATDKNACQAQLKNGIKKFGQGQLVQDFSSGSRIEANTFNLYAQMKQNKLLLTLKDNINWITYSKVYTENDIGKQINKKVELLDIYSAFEQIKVVKKEQPSEKSLQFLLKYKFGDILDFGRGSSFKIQKGGNVVVYTDTWIRASQNKLKVQSNLKLDKLKVMTDYQKFEAKSQIQKRQIFQSLSSEIQTLKNQIIVQNTFSPSLKHASTQLHDNQKKLKSIDDTPNKIATVTPSFQASMNIFQTNFKINVMTALEFVTKIVYLLSHLGKKQWIGFKFQYGRQLTKQRIYFQSK